MQFALQAHCQNAGQEKQLYGESCYTSYFSVFYKILPMIMLILKLATLLRALLYLSSFGSLDFKLILKSS
jgi:hypothetical protein